jgi:outer membrane protein assembly factor BamB
LPQSKDGSLVWKYKPAPLNDKILGNGRMVSIWPIRTSVLVDRGVAYFAAGVFPHENIYICAVDAETGSEIWTNDTVSNRAHELQYGGIAPQGYLVASDELLYVPSGRAMPYAFDRKNGEFKFHMSPGGKQGGCWTLLHEGEIIAGVDKQSTPTKIAYDAATENALGQNIVGSPAMTW